MKDLNKPKPLPCPFCGGEVTFHVRKGIYFQVVHVDRLCFVEMEIPFDNPAKNNFRQNDEVLFSVS